MKLRNKKTGEILETVRSAMVNKDKFRIYDEYTDKYYTYNSLAELNAEWEDYEEPKKYWFINTIGEINSINEDDEDEEDTKLCKQIGNYFNTREEAEKAVEKLKAWKRLKDKGFRFTDDLVYGEYYGCGSIRFIIFPSKEEKYVKDDLELLFSEAKNE